MTAKKPATPRAYQPAASGSGLQGEAHGRSKLTEDIVKKCRALVREGASVQDLAGIFEVSVPTMSKAVRGLTWQHLPDPVEDLPGNAKR